MNVVNTVEQSPFWHSTAIVVAYDDSDCQRREHLRDCGNRTITGLPE